MTTRYTYANHYALIPARPTTPLSDSETAMHAWHDKYTSLYPSTQHQSLSRHQVYLLRSMTPKQTETTKMQSRRFENLAECQQAHTQDGKSESTSTESALAYTTGEADSQMSVFTCRNTKAHGLGLDLGGLGLVEMVRGNSVINGSSRSQEIAMR